MKLPISLLMLAALGHAANTESAAKTTGDKATAAKSTGPKVTNQTGKRELLEGNFGERTSGIVTKYSDTASPGIVYAENMKEILADQSPTHQIFGARLPQIAKISDVLTGQGPPFEVAVANHLYAPVSVYQARLSSPTSFEVPSPAASQIAYSNSKAYEPRKVAEDNQKLQESPEKVADQPQPNINGVPVFALRQPGFHFESYPRPFGLSRQQSSGPQDVFRQSSQFSRLPAAQIFPLYDRPNKYPGHTLPTQYVQRQGIYQLVPIDPGFDYVNFDDNVEGKRYSNQETREELKAEATERPKLHSDIPHSKQGYHTHPNGAISFVKFSQSLPSNTQMEPQPEKFTQYQQTIEKLPSPHHPTIPRTGSEKQKFESVNEKLKYPSVFQQYFQRLQKIQPGFQQEMHFRPNVETQPNLQYITVQQPIRQQPRISNPLQQLLLTDPRISLPQIIQFQRLPALKPLPQSHFRAKTLFQPTTTSALIHERLPRFNPLQLLRPRSFGYHDMSTQNPTHIDKPLAPVSLQRHFTPLPPLKPNYNPTVKPLIPYTRTSPEFISTPLDTLPTVTLETQPIPDQIISSTTSQPVINDQQKHNDQSIHAEIQPQSQTSQQLESEITHQSQQIVLPLSTQSTTDKPFTKYESKSEYQQYSTPQPQHISTVHPQSIHTSPRHEVTIQRQELKEIILKPSPKPSSLLQQQHTRYEQEQEVHQLLSEQHQHELEQLQPQQHHREMFQLQSQIQQQHQSQVLQYPQPQQVTQQKETDQNKNQQYSEQLLHPFQTQQQQQHEQELLQTQQYEQITQKTETQQSESQQQLFTSNSEPSQEPQKHSESQLELQRPLQYRISELESASEKPHDQSEKLTSSSETTLSAPNSGEFLGPVLSQIQPFIPDIYAQPQDLMIQPEFTSLVGTATFPDVQFFRKFAPSLFGGIQ